MFVPDEKFAVDLLDALDDRCISDLSPRVYGAESKLDRCWAEQQYQMVDALLGWLDRKIPDAQEDERLRRAAGVLRDHLASARRDLDQTIHEIDETAGRRWRSQWDSDRG